MIKFRNRLNLQEGIHDKNIFKVIFIAGGPGSGKNYVMKKTVASFGLVEINSDNAFELQLKKAGLSLLMPDNEKSQRDNIRNRTKITTNTKMSLAIDGRLGLIINSTASSFDKISDQKTLFESLGYETAMIFVTVEDETSASRNKARGDRGGRSVPEEIRSEKFKESHNSRSHYAEIFERYWEIENNSTDPTLIEPKFMEYFKQIKKWIDKPVNNYESQNWIQTQKQIKENIKMDINEAFDDEFNELTEAHTAMQAKQAMTYHSAREKHHEQQIGKFKNPGDEGKLKYHTDKAENHGKAWDAAYKLSLKKYDDANPYKKKTIKEMRGLNEKIIGGYEEDKTKYLKKGGTEETWQRREMLRARERAKQGKPDKYHINKKNQVVLKKPVTEAIGHDGIELPEGMSADTWEVYKVLFSGIQDGSLTEEKLEQIEFVLEDTDIDLGNLLELSLNTLKSYHDKADADWKGELKKKNDGDYPKAFKRFAGKEKARLRINGTTPKQLNKLKNKKFVVNEAVKDMSNHENSDFHKVLTKHGFQHHSTNYVDNSNKANSKFQHIYTHKDHEKDRVRVWHWGSGDKNYIGHHEQKSNGILAPSAGDTKGQLDRTLTRHYGETKNT